MGEERENKNFFNNPIMKIMEGSIIGIVITLILLLILAIILANTDISESIISTSIITITGISIFISSLLIATKAKSKGILNGALVGGIYILLIYLISSIANSNFTLTINSIILILVSILMGAIGGIVGINLK